MKALLFSTLLTASAFAVQPPSAQEDFFSGMAPVHDIKRLPVEFAGKPNCHHGSHQFLVADFLKACATGTPHPVNVWTAAKYCAPGIIAHQSALREGEHLPIPDLGSAPTRLACTGRMRQTKE